MGIFMNTVLQRLVIAAVAIGAMFLLFWLFPNHIKPQEVLPFAFLICFYNAQNRDFRLHKPSDGRAPQRFMFFSSFIALLCVVAGLAYYGYVNGVWAGVIMFVAGLFMGALLSQIFTLALGNPHRLAVFGYIAWPVSAYLVYLLLRDREQFDALIAPLTQSVGQAITPIL